MQKSVIHYPANTAQLLDPCGSDDTDPVAFVSNRAVALYMGRCEVDVTKVECSVVVGIAAVTVTYAELALAVGDPKLLAAPASLTYIGWADCAAEVLAGNATFKKTLTMSRMPRRGEHVWLVVANQAATPATWRVCKGAGFGQHAGVVYRDAARPSTNLNSPLVFTYNSAVVFSGVQSRVGFNLAV